MDIHELIFQFMWAHNFVSILLSIPMALLGHRLCISSTRLIQFNFQSDCTNLFSYPWCLKVSIAPFSQQIHKMLLWIYLNLSVHWVVFLFLFNLCVYYTFSRQVIVAQCFETSSHQSDLPFYYLNGDFWLITSCSY